LISKHYWKKEGVTLQIDQSAAELLILLLIACMVLVITFIVSALTRPQRFRRASAFITSSAIFIVIVGVVTLVFGFWDILKEPNHPDMTRILAAILLVTLSVPILYIQKSKGSVVVSEPEISRKLDRSTNDAFTLGISLQFVLLTLFTSGVVSIEYVILLFSTVAISQVFLYVIAFFYHYEKLESHDERSLPLNE
jgi:hypothetical protein